MLQGATEKDDQLDAAMELLIAANALSPNHSESLTLAGFVHLHRPCYWATITAVTALLP